MIKLEDNVRDDIQKKQLPQFGHAMGMNIERTQMIVLNLKPIRKRKKRRPQKNVDREYQQGDRKVRFKPKSISERNPLEKISGARKETTNAINRDYIYINITRTFFMLHSFKKVKLMIAKVIQKYLSY